jgi:hypothetical protein
VRPFQQSVNLNDRTAEVRGVSYTSVNGTRPPDVYGAMDGASPVEI